MTNEPPPGPPEDSDRTIVIPSPGGRRRGGAASETTSQRADIEADRLIPGEAPPTGVGSNLLLREAATLLALVRQLRGIRSFPDVPALRAQVIDTSEKYREKLRNSGFEPKMSAQAHYALCGLIDETVLSTPWGMESLWSEKSLLITFYKEYSAGETFFEILRHARDYPRDHINLLELYYVCLSLGFQGKYRLVTGGTDQLARIKRDVYNVIHSERGEHERELSPHWMGLMDKSPKVSRIVPLWVFPVAAATIILLALFGLGYHLNSRSDLVYSRVDQMTLPVLRLPVAVVVAYQQPGEAKPADEPPQPDLGQRMRQSLQQEMESGFVDIRDQDGRVNVVLYGAAMFSSGSTALDERFIPIIGKIGLQISEKPGPFSVVGHTDSQPIRTLRFPSNWHLSKARAEAVEEVLAKVIPDRSKLRVIGRGDLDPVASNKTAEGRAANRRVEIHIPSG